MPRYTVGMTARQVLLLEDADIGDEGLTVTKLHLACEMACHNILTEQYGEDDASVGIHNDIWFWGDAASGELLHAEAMIARIDEKRIVFNVYARAGTTEVARGVHERLIVSRSRFMKSLPAAPA
ncbi:MAG: putative thioesterase [Paracoccaceae bacterium]|jgi:predicted thioesterase